MTQCESDIVTIVTIIIVIVSGRCSSSNNDKFSRKGQNFNLFL